MALQVTVPLSEKTYKRVKQWAESRQQNIGEAIADYLTNTLPDSDLYVIPPAEADENVEREKQAYIRLHPDLRQTHLGRYVAIYNGRLIDEDEDYGAMLERIDAHYPDKFVWLTQVKDEPIETLFVRSFRVEDE
jgi:hypothetical protein